MELNNALTLVTLESQDRGGGQQRQGWLQQFEADANLGLCMPEGQVTSDGIHLSIIDNLTIHHSVFQSMMTMNIKICFYLLE